MSTTEFQGVVSVIYLRDIGWSTTIPCYNPADVVANIHRLMDGQEMEPMHPWWRGFKGEIKATAKQKYDVTGVARKIDDSTIEITELPIHMWTKNFKEQLEGMMVGEKGDGVVKVISILSPGRACIADFSPHFTRTTKSITPTKMCIS